MEKLPTPCIAMDQRGCGRSDLGDPTIFSQEALVNDIHELVQTEIKGGSASPDGKIILLGHSLGGRIALAYAATHPENVAALVIEDMDIMPRPIDSAPFQVMTNDRKDEIFDRQADSLETAISNLKAAGYPDSRIERWTNEGRIEQQEDGTWWSHVNPMFRKLCYQHVLSTSKGRHNCQHIADSDELDFPVHLLVAGSEETVCEEESIEEMKAMLGDQLTIHRFPSAGHSIHSSAAEEFLKTMKSVVADAS